MYRRLAPIFASLSFILLLLVSAGDLKAGPLDDAKSQGLVGEQSDGYLGAVSGDGSVQGLINDINAKRKAKYEEIAKKRGAPTEAVAQIAGKKLVERTPAGQYVRGSDGQWKQR